MSDNFKRENTLCMRSLCTIKYTLAHRNRAMWSGHISN